MLASLITTDLPGPAHCPVVVIAAAGDPLFSLGYTRKVYDRIDSAGKELVVLESDEHLLFVEAVDLAVPAVLRLLTRCATNAPR